MTEVNVAELRQVLEAPSQYWVYPQFGGPPVSTDSPFVCVNRSTLTALLDAYEVLGRREQVPPVARAYSAVPNPLPGSYLRIIQQVLDRVLAGEPAAQVVRDFPDEYGYTIEGLERVERVLAAAREQRKREDLMLGLVSVQGHGTAESTAVTDWINAGAALDDALKGAGTVQPVDWRTYLLAYGHHLDGCSGLNLDGHACECGWIQVRDRAKEATDA